MNKLQLGIDIGRVLTPSHMSKTEEELRVTAQKIVDLLELGITVDEEPAFLMGLGYGCGDRCKTPIEEETKQLSGLFKQDYL